MSVRWEVSESPRRSDRCAGRPACRCASGNGIWECTRGIRMIRRHAPVIRPRGGPESGIIGKALPRLPKCRTDIHVLSLLVCEYLRHGTMILLQVNRRRCIAARGLRRSERRVRRNAFRWYPALRCGRSAALASRSRRADRNRRDRPKPSPHRCSAAPAAPIRPDSSAAPNPRAAHR